MNYSTVIGNSIATACITLGLGLYWMQQSVPKATKKVEPRFVALAPPASAPTEQAQPYNPLDLLQTQIEGGLSEAVTEGDGTEAYELPVRADEPLRFSTRIPNIELTTHDGRQVRFYDEFVKDRKVAVNFMYTVCKGICPGMTRNIKLVRKEMAARGIEDYVFVSVSIEPDRDTPEQMTKYMKDNGIENKPGYCPWIFVTGDLQEIDQLRRSLGVFDPDPEVDADRTQHGGILTIGNDRSDWWVASAALQEPRLILDTILRITSNDQRPKNRWQDRAMGRPLGGS
jgi:protein SCO1/2